MVGVAGKSQACSTCRQRRIKCDLRRPSCLKCVKSNRICTGYDRDLIFVNRTPLAPSTTATSVLSERRAQKQPKEILANPRIEADLHHLFSASSHDSREFRKYTLELLEATYLPKPPLSSLGLRPEASEGSFSWVYRLTDLTESSKSLDTSLFAFCLAQLHVTGMGKVSLYQCLDQYNIALQHLYSDLDDPEMRFREETLAAIVVLSTCELFICPAENGWSVHARGISEILRLRDPGTTNTPAWRHLFSRLRIVCTLEALTKRQAQVLEHDAWRQIVSKSNFNGALDEVYQMIADAPSILERAAAIPSIEDSGTLLKESSAVVGSILTMLKSIESWCDGFWNAPASPRAWLVPSCAVNPVDASPSDKTFPFCFEFESLSAAVSIILCWSVVAQLYSNIIQIHELVQVRLDRPITLEDILTQSDTDVVDIASPLEASGKSSLKFTTDLSSMQDIQSEGTKKTHYICQSLEYFHQIEMGTYGSHATTYPSWSARQYFRLHPGHEREKLWLENVPKMEGPGTRWGLSLMTFADVIALVGDLSR